MKQTGNSVKFLILILLLALGMAVFLSSCDSKAGRPAESAASAAESGSLPADPQNLPSDAVKTDDGKTAFGSAESLADYYAGLIRSRDASGMLEIAQLNASDDYLESWKNLSVKDVGVLEVYTSGSMPYVKYKIEVEGKDGALFYDDVNIRWLMIREIDSKWVALSRLSDRPPFG